MVGVNDLSRRGFLKGATLAGVAVALGRLPALPAPAAVPAIPAAAVASPSWPTVVKMSSWIPVTTETYEDLPFLRFLFNGGITGGEAKTWAYSLDD